MKGIRIMLCCVVLCLFFPRTAYAEEIISEKDSIDIIFVIDCSGSMKANDPSQMGLSMVQAFVDTVHADDIRIGYVAYNDGISSFLTPQPITTAEQRETLKVQIGSIAYTGDTDIGLGISYAYGLLSAEKSDRQMIVLISDGETDLPGGGERTMEQSNRELEQCARQCREEGIRIYTVAFGQYDGSREVLEEIAAQTEGESYSAREPEDLIEVLYGIFQENLIYKIQQFSSGIYAGGRQEIRCVLDAPYLDEINVLLLSSKPVGETVVQYGSEEITLTGLSRYAVGKIENTGTLAAGKDLVIRPETDEGQDLQVYVISYRELTPVLRMDAAAEKNRDLEYQVYFRDRTGAVITDTGFYEAFSWELVCEDSGVAQERASVSDGMLKGKLCFSHSGTYALRATLSDEFGSFSFEAGVTVTNTMPEGGIPEDRCTLLKKAWTLDLEDYFTDKDNDKLLYSVKNVEEGIDVRLEGSRLTIRPQSVGVHNVAIQISDGESAVQYAHRIRVIPLWQEYWWVIVSGIAALAILLWKLLHKPKPELERLTEEKKQNHFCGKLDAYFIMQPEEEEEIPPLSFRMSKVKDSRVSLGALLGAYPEQAKALQLEEIFLIADEDRSMVLYHRSKSGVMVGNAIACIQIQYSIGFGDIIYITSPDGRYDLEIHYVAVSQ